jgi:dTDP-4-amino-4,6-dideoxygalactose transaminase
MNVIGFNKPYLAGNELTYIQQAVELRNIAGNGVFTRKCQAFFEETYKFRKTLLTTSCTDALEMAALLLNIKPGDEIIVPSYTFVSTANAFLLRGAKIVFADSQHNHPNIDSAGLDALITPNTKAIVIVHYAGVACDMDQIVAIAKKNNIYLIEDAAQAIDSYYNGKPLGGIGHLAAFSFHETKNLISGEGGMLVLNNSEFSERAEVIWEKGTNRAAFFKGEIDKYGWVDIGSSFLPSEIIAAFLWAQIEHLDVIQKRRKEIWQTYFDNLKPLAEAGHVSLPVIPTYASNNAHMFYLVCANEGTRDSLIKTLKSKNIHAVFHYLSLHRSPYFTNKHDNRELPNSDRFSTCLVRLPFYFELSQSDQWRVIKEIENFFHANVAV